MPYETDRNWHLSCLDVSHTLSYHVNSSPIYIYRYIDIITALPASDAVDLASRMLVVKITELVLTS
jgi:hypothetical protein